MKRLTLAACVALSAPTLLGYVSAQTREIEIPATSRLVSPDEQLLQRDLNYLLAPIKSKSALERFLAEGRASALDALSGGAKSRFLESLTFSTRGLSGFRYDDLEAELTPTQIYQVLALFGQQHNARFLEHARVETELDRSILNQAGGQKCFGPFQSQQGCGLEFLEDYKCESAGTCVVDNLRACTDNC